MSKEKISSQEIIDLLASKAVISKKAAEDFLKSMFGIIEDTLIAGEQVKVKGFGTFKLQWNEPRKSVNVQTGEEFIIEGYHKVTFTPESAFKDLVNEPFAHLEPIVLDDVNQQSTANDTVYDLSGKQDAETDEAGLDPLKIFTEQADEIKGLLWEINSMSAKPKVSSVTPDVSRSASDIPDYFAGETTTTNTDEEDEDAANEEYVGAEQFNDEEEPVAPLPVDVNPVVTEMVQEKVAEVDPVDIIPENKAVNSHTTKPEVEPIHPEEDAPVAPVASGIADNKVVENNEPKTPMAPVVEHRAQNVAGKVQNRITEQEKSEILSFDENDPFIAARIRKRRKPRIWLIVLLVFLLLIGGFVVNYYLSSATRCWCEYSLLSDANRQKLQDLTSPIKAWFGADDDKATYENPSGVVMPNPVADKPKANDTTETLKKDTVAKVPTVAKSEPAKPKVDSVKVLLENPRTYKEYIGTEKIEGGSRLTLMAEKYYGHKDFWVYIYEANKNNIKNPDKIAAGTVVKIPKLDKRLIDKNDPRCLKKARELHDLYVGKR